MANIEAIETTATLSECEALIGGAIGRLLSLGSRPTQDGDAEAFQMIHDVVIAAGRRAEALRAAMVS